MGFKCLMEVMVAENKKLNKRIIAALMAGTMSLSFTGCGIKDKYTYDDHNKTYKLRDAYSLNDLKNEVHLIEIEKDNEAEIFLSYVELLDSSGKNNEWHFNPTKYFLYHDVLTNDVLYTKADDNENSINSNKLINDICGVESYLVSFNLIKEFYREDDMKELLERIKSVYTFSDSKEKVLKKN